VNGGAGSSRDVEAMDAEVAQGVVVEDAVMVCG
jgi:hypothetical protein